MFNMFRQSWLNTGEVKQYIEEHDLDEGRVSNIMKSFAETEAWQIIKRALMDYRIDYEKRMMATPIDDPHYERKMLVCMLKLTMGSKFVGLVEELQGFAATETKAKSGLRDKYL